VRGGGGEGKGGEGVGGWYGGELGRVGFTPAVTQVPGRGSEGGGNQRGFSERPDVKAENLY